MANRTLLAAVLISLAPLATQAGDLASCSGMEGTGYFPAYGLVPQEESGWAEEKITGGMTKLVKAPSGELDLLFLDSRQEIFSVRQSGGSVVLLTKSADLASVLVVYPLGAVEVYTFLKNHSGQLEVLYTKSAAGSGTAITKVAAMRGDCSYIEFDGF